MALWYQPPSTLNRISPTLKLNLLCCTCSYNLSISNSRPTHIPKLEPETIFASVKTFIPATVANLGLFIDLSVHHGKISIKKIYGDAAGKINRNPLSNCAGIAVIEVMKMLEI